jgi:hypothetical protein
MSSSHGGGDDNAGIDQTPLLDAQGRLVSRYVCLTRGGIRLGLGHLQGCRRRFASCLTERPLLDETEDSTIDAWARGRYPGVHKFAMRHRAHSYLLMHAAQLPQPHERRRFPCPGHREAHAPRGPSVDDTVVVKQRSIAEGLKTPLSLSETILLRAQRFCGRMHLGHLSMQRLKLVALLIRQQAELLPPLELSKACGEGIAFGAQLESCLDRLQLRQPRLEPLELSELLRREQPESLPTA